MPGKRRLRRDGACNGAVDPANPGAREITGDVPFGLLQATATFARKAIRGLAPGLEKLSMLVVGELKRG